MITAIIMLVIGIKNSQVCWRIDTILTLILMIAGGILLFIGLFMVGAAFCFFFIEDSSFINILTYGGKEHGKYPIDIYGKGLMRFCTYIIPYTLIQYYPLQYLLGRSNQWQYAFYPFGTVIFLIICYSFWRFGMKNYKSSGS
jgi:ABC-2 type transport system permease protein